MVAESMVILAPMSQFGCLSASFFVTFTKSRRAVLRKGPPEAVRNDLFDGIVQLQALENGRMFRIDRKNGDTVLQRQFVDNFTGDDHGFLVGQSDGLASLDGPHRGQQTGIADHGSQYDVDGFRFDNLSNGVHAGIDFDGEVFQRLLQLGVQILVADDDRFGHKFPSLLDEQVHLVVGRKRINFKFGPVGSRITSNACVPMEPVEPSRAICFAVMLLSMVQKTMYSSGFNAMPFCHNSNSRAGQTRSGQDSLPPCRWLRRLSPCRPAS